MDVKRIGQSSQVKPVMTGDRHQCAQLGQSDNVLYGLDGLGTYGHQHSSGSEDRVDLRSATTGGCRCAALASHVSSISQMIAVRQLLSEPTGVVLPARAGLLAAFVAVHVHLLGRIVRVRELSVQQGVTNTS